MKRSAKNVTDELRPEYDLAELLKGGIVGKHAKSFQAGTNLVLIEPHIHSQFRSDQEVNDALRLVLELRKLGGTRRAPRRSSPKS